MQNKKVRTGRKPRLTEDQVREMRLRRKNGAFLKELAYDFGCSFNYAARIVNRQDRAYIK